MRTYPPELDKARRTWLESLEVGDEVATVWWDDPGVGSADVLLTRICSIEEHRIHIGDRANREWYYRTGKQAGWAGPWQQEGGGGTHLEPVTDENRRRARLSVYRDKFYKTAETSSMAGGNTVTDDQIEAIAKIFGWDVAEDRGLRLNG